LYDLKKRSGSLEEVIAEADQSTKVRRETRVGKSEDNPRSHFGNSLGHSTDGKPKELQPERVKKVRNESLAFVVASQPDDPELKSGDFPGGQGDRQQAQRPSLEKKKSIGK